MTSFDILTIYHDKVVWKTIPERDIYPGRNWRSAAYHNIIVSSMGLVRKVFGSVPFCKKQIFRQALPNLDLPILSYDILLLFQ